MKITIKIMPKTATKIVSKTATKIVLKNYNHNKKKMSFLKISDPDKRDLMVKEYLDLKKNIRSNLLSERTGEQQLQTDLSKFYRPITETQKATTKEITEELKPIKEGIENLPQAITFPAYPSMQAFKEPLEGEDTQYIGEVAEKYLRKFLAKEEVDRMYGLHDKDGIFHIGNKLAIIVDNDLIVGKDEYEGTPCLWELIVSKNRRILLVRITRITRS